MYHLVAPICSGLLLPLEGPHTSGKRTFLDLKIRGRIETMCWGPASSARIPELGHQRCVPLGVSRMTLALFSFCLLVL